MTDIDIGCIRCKLLPLYHILLVQALPKLLWSQAAPAGHKTSRLVLRMLHDAARYARRGSAVSRTLDELQPQLAPLFSTDVTGVMKKGDGNPAVKMGGREVLLGPVFKLPQELQVFLPSLVGLPTSQVASTGHAFSLQRLCSTSAAQHVSVCSLSVMVVRTSND